MSDRLDNVALRQPRPLLEQGGLGASSPHPGQVGSWRGEGVRLAPPDAATLLANAKEELTFAMSEKLESRTLKERKVSAPGEAMVERIQKIQEIEEWLERLPDLDPGETAAFLEEARRGGRDAQALLGRARERFGDPSHAFAALDIGEQALRREGRTEEADAAARARETLLEAEGPAVRAGINISVAAFEAAKADRGAAAELRDLYRQVVLGNPAPAAMYRAILEKFGTEDFAGRLAFLTRAVGDDLRAAGPSIEPAQLRETIDGLSGLRVLDTAHDRCATLAKRLGRLCGVTPPVTEVMRALLPLSEQTTQGPGTVMPILRQVGLPDKRLDAQILMMREARGVMAALPTGIFRDQDTRFAVLRSMQEAMDSLIEREEAQ